jgi:Ni,Fe-hydrogenase maturation factor
MTISTQILVIGYGRCDRGDDAIGPQIAAAIGSMNLPQVTARAVDRLTPELASHLATANGVIFIDACKMPAPATGEGQTAASHWLRNVGVIHAGVGPRL